MKHLLLSILLLFGCISVFADTTLEGNFVRYWDYGPTLNFEIQYSDTSIEKFTFPDDTQKGHMSFGNFLEMMEDTLFLEDVKDSLECLYGDDFYIPDSLTSRMVVVINDDDSLVSVEVLPLEKVRRGFCAMSNIVPPNDSGTAAFIETGYRTSFQYVRADSTFIRVYMNGHWSQYNAYFRMVNCDVKTSLGFEALKILYTHDRRNYPQRVNAVNLLIWDQQNGPPYSWNAEKLVQ